MADVVVVGAGLGGCLLTLSLHQQGFRVTIIDRHSTYPAEFRAEQIVGSQLDVLRRFGVLNGMVAGVPLISEAQAYTRGRLLAPVSTLYYGLSYQTMAQAVRNQIPGAVPL